ncbi:MAG: hypothetical protein E7159_04675 [Firmicutes bacterium]|nr:hypothetical protein [Bacillota bacterium]
MNKGSKIIIGLLIFIIIGIAVVLILNDRGIIHLCGSCKCEPNCPKCEEKKCDDSTNSEQKALIIAKGSDYNVEWKSDGSVVVKLGEEEKTIASNVTRYYDFKLGMSDMCSGRGVLIFESNNTIVTALDMDALVCGKNVSLIDNLDSVGTFDHLIQKNSHPQADIPVDYQIYAYRNGSEEDISSYFWSHFRH